MYFILAICVIVSFGFSTPAKKRYFLVSYMTFKDNQISSYGDCTVETQNDSFFNRKQFIKWAGKEHKADGATILNIQELSEVDFKSFTK